MDKLEFKKLLFEVAFCTMACDGDIDKREIEEKLLNGKKELELLLSRLNISKNSYKVVFCLVYNKFVPIEERYKRGLHKSLSFEFLNQYKDNGFIDDIYTEDTDFFTKQFKKQFKKELTC